MKRFLRAASALLLASLLFLGFPLPSEAADKEEVDRIISSIPEGWPQAPQVAAKAAILMDADSGEILYAKNATEAMYPASTTKLMTALLTLENASLGDIVDFPFAATNIPAGSSHIGMRRGEQMVLRECLYGLLLPSANEVANALAIHISGYIDNFVVLMNEKAYQLGMVNTVYKNANGLHDPAHYTCAYDLALLMRACAANSTFTEIASRPSYVHHADELLNKDIPMTNTHLMLRKSSEYYNENVLCGKTGHTEESGYNLVTCAEKDGVRLVVVTLGCESGMQYVATQSLLDFGFNYFRQVLPAELDSSLSMENAFTSSPLAIPTPGFSLLSVNTSDTILLPDNVTFDDLEKQVSREDGEVRIQYLYKGYPLGSVALNRPDGGDDAGIFAVREEGALVPEPVPDLAVVDGLLLILAFILFGLAVLTVLIFARMMLPRRRKRHRRL